MIFQRVRLSLDYPVAFTRDVFDSGNRTLVEIVGLRARVVAVVDANVLACWPGLADSIKRYAHHYELDFAGLRTVPGGEAAKDAGTLEALWGELAALRVDRHSYVVAIGGGAALDVIGFAAATLHRGVRLVRIPTTVLAQNDAGIGVKNGINAFGAKNFLGTFAAPFAVIDDIRFLDTLPERDRIAGMAEAVKVALVRDRELFDWLGANAPGLRAFETSTVELAIRRCAELHLDHIATGGDPFEQGNARPLDYGHWAAHKLEILSGHELRHGEAVAIGMAVDARYATLAGLLSAAEADAIIALVEALGLPTWHDLLRDPRLIGGLDDFREHLGGELCITLLAGLGRGVDARDIAIDKIERAIDHLADHLAAHTSARTAR